MRCALAPVLLTCALGLAACGGDDATTSAQTGSAVQVAAAFYPLQFLAERIGGEDAVVTSLAAPGAEPHDLELTPKQVAGLAEDDLVLYLKGFQPAVDEAVAEQATSTSFDVSTVAPLQGGFVPLEEGVAHEDDKGDDPHLWLDPVRFAAVGDAVAARMADAEPDRAEAFRTRAAALRTELMALDASYRTGLAGCARKEIVTSHNAFGYLARAYGLQQVALTGLTPDAEASPGTLERVARYARSKGVTTVFFEELVSPKVAQTLADEVGAKAVALSPLESAPESGDYLAQMRANLSTLQTALGCSPA